MEAQCSAMERAFPLEDAHAEGYTSDVWFAHVVKKTVHQREISCVASEVAALKVLNKTETNQGTREKHVPTLLCYNSSTMYMTHAGEALKKATKDEPSNIPPDWKQQVHQICKLFQECNIRHNDIKRDALFVRNGTLVVIDFGWASKIDAPPEHPHEHLRRSCDMYALVTTIHALLRIVGEEKSIEVNSKAELKEVLYGDRDDDKNWTNVTETFAHAVKHGRVWFSGKNWMSDLFDVPVPVKGPEKVLRIMYEHNGTPRLLFIAENGPLMFPPY